MQGAKGQEKVPRLSRDFTSQAPVDIKSMMPTERKSMWRTAEERRMSDLTRVLEWMERRWGKKKRAMQRQKANEEFFRVDKEDKKIKASQKKKEAQRVSFQGEDTKQKPTKRRESKYSKTLGVEQLGKQLNINLSKDGQRKSGASGSRRGSDIPDLDIKDAIALESTQRPYRRQSSSLDPILQDGIFSGRRVNIMRDWATKTPDTTYERRLKSLMDKGTEPKIENVKMLKPEEVLSCRYLRLSKNNIRTLLKLCKDVGMDVDIHPHMVEAEIDAKKVFDTRPSIAL
ncbi:uncharacterized protein C16orf78 homolog [Dipodomys merriami]|uniref:uncharacterized protein C16orf78 homolog n=1 Tax=Dipodomys merriami TaxID=94247 RepID=UPI003855CC24